MTGLGSSGFDVRCATLSMPLDRAAPGGPDIDVYVEAFEPGPGVPLRAQLWMLQGGPGGASAYGLASYATVINAAIPGVEVLLLDHRGTGLSSRIVCDGERPESALGTTLTDAEWSACVDLLVSRRDTASHFSTTEAAADVGDAIDLLRRPGVPVYVWGGSYGTYWAHRYLQLFPAQADGVILDSTCSPGECSFPVAFSANFERVAESVLGLCAADAGCRARLGPDPVARLRAALTAFDAGTCPAAASIGFTGFELRQTVASFLYDTFFRNALPAIVLRASRCAPGDAFAFEALNSAFEPVEGPPEEFDAFSFPTYAIVARSELWDRPATPAEEDVVIRSMIAYSPMRPGPFEAWLRVPTYDAGILRTSFASTSVPVMMWQGELDPQTSVMDAAPLRAHFSGPFQTYVELPRAVHGILASHGTTTFDDCGLRMLDGFITDPRAPVDTGCIDQVPLLSFADDPSLASVFGGSSLYDPAFLPPRPDRRAPSPEELVVRERFRDLVHRTPVLGP